MPTWLATTSKLRICGQIPISYVPKIVNTTSPKHRVEKKDMCTQVSDLEFFTIIENNSMLDSNIDASLFSRYTLTIIRRK